MLVDMSLFYAFLYVLLQVIKSLPGIVTISIAGFLTFLYYFTAPKYGPLEPPPLSHFIPFFGHALSFVRDQRSFFEWANKKTHGEPFSMLVAGDKLYIFHRPDDVSLIFRKSSTLHETRSDQKDFRLNILGFHARDAARIVDLRDTERHIHTAHLLTGEALERTLACYFDALDRELDDLDTEVGARCGQQQADDGLCRNGFELVGDVLMRATVQALFGRDSFVAYDGLFRDFRQFLSERFFQRMIGLPDFVARGAVRARERIKSRLAAVVASLDDRPDVSGYVQERVKKLGELGLSPEGIVSNEFDIILGSNLNSIPVAYLSLLHLLTPSSPPPTDNPSNPDPQQSSLLISILTELHVAKWAELSPHSRAQLVPTGLPRLHALVREVLRFHTTAWSAREVSATTLIELSPGTKPSPTAAAATTSAPRVYELESGAIIAMPSSLLHHDPAVHAEPDVFDPERFLATDLGGRGTAVSNATLRPFGGGASYCPGRRFAEKQVVGFLAALLARFDVVPRSVDGRELRIPRNADFFYVTAQKDVGVVVRRRERGDGVGLDARGEL